MIAGRIAVEALFVDVLLKVNFLHHVSSTQRYLKQLMLDDRAVDGPNVSAIFGQLQK